MESQRWETDIDARAFGFAFKQIRYKVLNFRDSRSNQSNILGFMAHLVSSELSSLLKMSAPDSKWIDIHNGLLCVSLRGRGIQVREL